jgi:hypothetical protein
LGYTSGESSNLALEVQELADVIKILIMLNLKEGVTIEKTALNSKVTRFISHSIESKDFDEALSELTREGIVEKDDKNIRLSKQGVSVSSVWKTLLFKTDPVTEIVAGLTDGSISGLIVILTAVLAGLSASIVALAAVLTLAAVAMTNFSSFLLGGKTEDIADLLAIKSLINYSLSDMTDTSSRDKSYLIIKSLFKVLNKKISKSNFYAALMCGITTLLAGAIPIAFYYFLPEPFDIIVSLGFVGIIVVVFLVRYRSKKSKTPLKLVLFETVGLIVIATLISLLIGGGI